MKQPGIIHGIIDHEIGQLLRFKLKREGMSIAVWLETQAKAYTADMQPRHPINEAIQQVAQVFPAQAKHEAQTSPWKPISAADLAMLRTRQVHTSNQPVDVSPEHSQPQDDFDGRTFIPDAQ